MKKIPAFEIALSAVACAVATLFLSLGVLNNFLLATGYIVACFALMLPLAKGFVWGNVLAYIATALLTLLLGGLSFPWRLLPFVLIFGLHPLINHLQLKYRLNVWICLIVKTVWFVASLVLIWYVWCVVLGLQTSFEWLDNYLLPVILIGGTLFFYFYDRLIFRCQQVIDRLVARIRK